MSPLRVAHIIQPAILCRDMDDTMDRLHTMFGIYPSERVDIVNTGVNNAVFALGDFTFLELIEPYASDSAAMRLLERGGEGFHMVALDLEPRPNKEVDAELERAGFRVVRRNSVGNVEGAWHIHPKDTFGVLMALNVKKDTSENCDWAGKPWRAYVGTNTRVLHSILGVSIACEDLPIARELYQLLGFEFGESFRDNGDEVAEAKTPRGTLLQLRCPTGGNTSIARYQLERRGVGLCHLLLSAPDLSLVFERMQRAAGGARIDTSGKRLWSDPEATWGIPFEIRVRGREGDESPRP